MPAPGRWVRPSGHTGYRSETLVTVSTPWAYIDAAPTACQASSPSRRALSKSSCDGRGTRLLLQAARTRLANGRKSGLRAPRRSKPEGDIKGVGDHPTHR